jgi:hypothetical protein
MHIHFVVRVNGKSESYITHICHSESNIIYLMVQTTYCIVHLICFLFLKIAPKRWRLEINFSQDAVLMLSSMNLPDGIQRRRTAVDELNMRSIFEENDVICVSAILALFQVVI